MLKRIFDVAITTAGLIVLSPFLLIIGLAVKLTSPGPIFYGSPRVGLAGRQFKLLKFRSMVVNADQIGPAVTGASDPRVTSAGRVLRRSKLDELPQLWNVLIGDMSLVGPRPEAPNYVALYTSEQRKVLDVRPGITSLASVQYRNEEAQLTGDNWEQLYIQQIMPAKLALDLEYARSASLLHDIQIILQTFLALFR